jgi:hypothetical protein
VQPPAQSGQREVTSASSAAHDDWQKKATQWRARTGENREQRLSSPLCQLQQEQDETMWLTKIMRSYNSSIDEAKIERRKLREEYDEVQKRLWVRHPTTRKLMYNPALSDEEWSELKKRDTALYIAISGKGQHINELRGERFTDFRTIIGEAITGNLPKD